MTKARPVVMYLEQVRVYGEPISVTRSEVLFAKSDGTTVMPHNRVLTKADNKTMGESFLNELIYVLGAQEGDERHIPSDREILVYTSNEKDSDNYRCYLNAINSEVKFTPSSYQADAIEFGDAGTSASGAAVTHGDYADANGTEAYLIESDDGNVMAFTNSSDMLTAVLGLQ